MAHSKPWPGEIRDIRHLQALVEGSVMASPAGVGRSYDIGKPPGPASRRARVPGKSRGRIPCRIVRRGHA